LRPLFSQTLRAQQIGTLACRKICGSPPLIGTIGDF
jgi:hypothetical protein